LIEHILPTLSQFRSLGGLKGICDQTHLILEFAQVPKVGKYSREVQTPDCEPPFSRKFARVAPSFAWLLLRLIK
jgi:hypothetical protein